jgi:hypothetical protein
MADVTTYKRALFSYISSTTSVQFGEVRSASDAVVLAHPAYWTAFSDAEIVRLKVH